MYIFKYVSIKTLIFLVYSIEHVYACLISHCFALLCFAFALLGLVLITFQALIQALGRALHWAGWHHRHRQSRYMMSMAGTDCVLARVAVDGRDLCPAPSKWAGVRTVSDLDIGVRW